LQSDGQPIHRSSAIAKIEGPAAAILTAERTALNFLQRLSGIATTAASYAEACAGTKARIIDTRKTAPGLRMLDKYAVRMGGAFNHRTGLFDGVLIKENHIRAGGGIIPAVMAARERAPHTTKIEVECETIEEVDEALAAGADIILLDNMTVEQMTGAVRKVDGRALIEASGNMTLERIPEVARTGVDFISVGALTHSVRALNLSLQIISWHLPGELKA
ncbi:MAG: carboxylating nicotinate-nucleotide diphosphorylase, partial [Chloroflexi bacterium]|nr:carboxylating nicotinate-nucleotide diphosphorylase [Chloroflexota bacterium]